METRSFFIGFIGVLAAVLACLLLYPMYSDYRAAAQTSRWLAEVEPAQRLVAENARRLNSLVGAGVGVGRPNFSAADPELFEVTPEGTILIKGGLEGQLVVLIPTRTNGQVAWRCLGGPDSAVLSCGGP